MDGWRVAWTSVSQVWRHVALAVVTVRDVSAGVLEDKGPCPRGPLILTAKPVSFIFGGRNAHEGASYSEIFVLGLPGFFWTKVTYPNPGSIAYSRYGHACAVVGRRQLLSWGGIMNLEWREKDPFPSGLGIFDLSTWECKDRYDSGAEEYTQHPTIRDWSDKGYVWHTAEMSYCY